MYCWAPGNAIAFLRSVDSRMRSCATWSIGLDFRLASSDILDARASAAVETGMVCAPDREGFLPHLGAQPPYPALPAASRLRSLGACPNGWASTLLNDICPD